MAPMSFQTAQTPPILSTFLEVISRALAAQDPAPFAVIFNTSFSIFSSKPLQALRNELRRIPNPTDTLRTLVETALTDDWLSFNEAVSAYLEYIIASDPTITDGPEPRTWAQEEELLNVTVNWYEKMHNFLSALTTAFNTPRGGILAQAIRRTARDTLNTANYCDHAADDINRPHTAGLLNTIVKTFNSSLAERTTFDSSGAPQLGKKAAMLDLANCLFKLYMKLREHRLVTTIIDNLSACDVPLEYPNFPKATLVTYHFYRGLHHLHNSSFFSAKSSFEDAYTLCSKHLLPQRRRILVPLLCVSLILGYLPHSSIYTRPEAIDLLPLFTPLYIAIRHGDFRTFRLALGDEDAPNEDTLWRRRFWEQHAVYYLLQHRLQPQLWRGLLRKVYLLTEHDPMKPLVISVENVVVCANLLHKKRDKEVHGVNPLFHGKEEEEEQETWWAAGEVSGMDVEAVIGNLLDQGWVQGYMARAEDGGGLLVLSRKRPFPEVATVWMGGEWKEEKVVEKPEAGAGRVVRLSGVKVIGEK